jgi:prepilin-type N-terminal cleavage/methylation domain-containing protein
MRVPDPGCAVRDRGFTLQEMIAALLVLGVVSAIALSRMDNAPVLVSTQAEQLASDIRYAQTLAMTKAQRYIVSFPSATSYRFLDSTGNPVAHPLTGSSAAIVLASGITLQASVPGGNALGFDGRGVPYSVTAPATFNGTLASQATITLSKEESSRTSTVAPQTGKVTP